MMNTAGLAAEDVEAVEERAAILEHDAGLSRSEAEEKAVGKAENRAREGLHEGHNRDTIGPYTGHNEAPRGPDINTPSKPAAAVPTAHPAPIAADPLAAWIAEGIAVLGTYESGAAIATGEDYRKAFTKDLREVASLREGRGDAAGRAKGTKIERFRFIPGDAGLLCIDIDMGHEDGGNGLSAFYVFFMHLGLTLPDYLKDIPAGSFPCYTKTPGGGFHLHFKYKGAKRYPHQYLAQGVEVFHFGNALTAPGSKKATGDYTLFGTLAQAPTLPAVIENRLIPYQDARPGAVKPRFTYERPDWQKTPPPMTMIAQWAVEDGNFDGRNRLCFEIARRAARTDYGYTAEEVEDFLKSYPQTAGHAQIRDAVKSAFKGRSK